MTWDKVSIGFLTVGKSIEWVLNAWEKFRPVEEFVERRYHERRKHMGNPVAEVKLALQILSEVQQDLPTLAKGLLDLKQAWADKSDPTKLSNDFGQFITDNEPMLQRILAMVPDTAAAVSPTGVPPAA